jgi:hypothetical protein
MQHPVRYYISQNDDQPVVRTVPVEHRARPAIEAPVVAANESSSQRRTRVHRLVRAAIRRERSHR